MNSFTARNVKIYFRDKTAVFFSLLSVLIVLALYLLFLGKNLASSLSDLKEAQLLANVWLLAGICSITPLTTALSALATPVGDRANGTAKDFFSSPVPRFKLVAGYMAGGILVSLVMSFITLALGLLFLVSSGYPLPGMSNLLAIGAVLALSCVSNTAILMFFVSWIRSVSAFSTVSTIVGTVIGFLAGVYLPISSYPQSVQQLLKFVPPAHSASLLRYYLMESMIPRSFEGLPASVQPEVWLALGVRFEWGDGLFPLWGSMAYIAAAGLVFFALTVYLYSRKKEAASK